MDIQKAVSAIQEEVIGLRRDLHRHPELGFREYRTSKIISEYLAALNLDEIHQCSGTGVIGILRGSRPGKTVMMRADIDALPIQEESGEPFSSETPGIAHACGHDGHTAMLLGEAKIWASHRDQIPGTLVFLFQPNEEDAGAQVMIDDGALELAGNPQAVFGCHLKSNSPIGTISMAPGPMMASSYYFRIRIKGKGGHGGYPHLCINPISAASHVIAAIDTFNSLEQSVFRPTVISTGMIHAGEKEIVIPDFLEMQGSVRCLHFDHEQVHARLRELVTKACDLCRCTCEIELKCGNSLLANDEKLFELAKETAGEVVGADNVLTRDVAVMGGDDFAEFSMRIPGMYYFIGMADPEKGTDVPNHNTKFRLNEDALATGMEMQMKLVTKYLNS